MLHECIYGECAHEQNIRRTLTLTLTHTITAYSASGNVTRVRILICATRQKPRRWKSLPCDHSLSVGPYIHDYKSLRVAVMIYVTLVNTRTQTDTRHLTGYISSARNTLWGVPDTSNSWRCCGPSWRHSGRLVALRLVWHRTWRLHQQQATQTLLNTPLLFALRLVWHRTWRLHQQQVTHKNTSQYATLIRQTALSEEYEVSRVCQSERTLWTHT